MFNFEIIKLGYVATIKGSQMREKEINLTLGSDLNFLELNLVQHILDEAQITKFLVYISLISSNYSIGSNLIRSKERNC